MFEYSHQIEWGLEHRFNPLFQNTSIPWHLSLSCYQHGDTHGDTFCGHLRDPLWNCDSCSSHTWHSLWPSLWPFSRTLTTDAATSGQHANQAKNHTKISTVPNDQEIRSARTGKWVATEEAAIIVNIAHPESGQQCIGNVLQVHCLVIRVQACGWGHYGRL